MGINESVIEEGDFAEIVVKANNGEELSEIETTLRFTTNEST